MSGITITKQAIVQIVQDAAFVAGELASCRRTVRKRARGSLERVLTGFCAVTRAEEMGFDTDGRFDEFTLKYRELIRKGRAVEAQSLAERYVPIVKQHYESYF